MVRWPMMVGGKMVGWLVAEHSSSEWPVEWWDDQQEVVGDIMIDDNQQRVVGRVGGNNEGWPTADGGHWRDMVR